ncbi:amphi-Trp domain-containing protein [Halobiforma nitratireducens]|uniref:Amphi-Trp domain-containing protein n=1 Tax=Halobiforma nitratireducens JCM 10879 TaxID=1227454 RepID=M0M219_9EURY|nr:amphi-Trp domain-containing protein [Halobiforma nitratireducens]EMA39872.1 hypothetical protein C446_08134 [Halobiforma nitratireducens JCM 10879]
MSDDYEDAEERPAEEELLETELEQSLEDVVGRLRDLADALEDGDELTVANEAVSVTVPTPASDDAVEYELELERERERESDELDEFELEIELEWTAPREETTIEQDGDEDDVPSDAGEDADDS